MLFDFIGFFTLIISMTAWMAYEISTIDRKARGKRYDKKAD